MMKNLLTLLLITTMSCQSFSQGENEDPNFAKSDDLKITNAQVIYDESLEHLVFTISVNGKAGKSVPSAAGQLDGAPVLGYVFPTNLKSMDVGFSETNGIVALALTSHPDFDDTPLWDENYDRNYANDGIIWHPHWVVLTEDKRVAGGLAVKQFDPEKDEVTLPPTNPGMPMYMDSPGFHVIIKGNQIKVVVPTYRVSGKTEFSFDGVAAYMQVNTSKKDLPMLGVYAVYSMASGDLSLPYTVE
ncbi:hypothetical protein [Ekhidna sp.]|jgi:hypothetical protein|uniref:hypothetical protein n=1 Tax=Ekhidna sp. TaxID=2608089 RepID=UPI0032EBFD60